MLLGGRFTSDLFKEELNKERGGEIGKRLRQLSYDHKVDLIAAVFVNSETEIAHYLLDSKRVSAEDQSEFKKFIKTWCENSDILSNIEKNIIAYVCQPPDELPEQDKAALDKKTVLLLQYAACKISDFQMSITIKMKLCEQICVQLQIEETLLTKIRFDFGHIESLEPLEGSRYSGDVDVNHYATAIAVSDLDYSEFILLTLGAIQTVCRDDKIMQELNSVRKLYFAREYEKAIQELTNFVEKRIGTSHLKFTEAFSNKLKSGLREVTLNKNYCRRFYENRIVQFYLGRPIDWVSIYRIVKAIVPIFSETRDIVPRSPSLRLRSVIDGVSYFSEYDENKRHVAIKKLKSNSPAYVHRTNAKGTKHIILSYDAKTNELNTVSARLISKNKGVILASQLNLHPEMSDQNQLDKVVDEFLFRSEETMLPLGRRTVLAGALSGSTFDIIPILEKYIEEHAAYPGKSKDLSNLIKAFICHYVNRGYHSIYEIIDVFAQPNVKKIFDDNHIELDLSWDDDLLEFASRDTQAYAEAACLSRARNEELALVPYAVTRPLHRMAESGNTAAMELLLERKLDVNEALWNGDTPLYLALEGGHFEIARMLFQHADLDLSDQHKNLRALSILSARLYEPEYQNFLNTIPTKFKKIVFYELLKNAIESNDGKFSLLVALAPDLINFRDFMDAIFRNPWLVIDEIMARHPRLLRKLLNENPEINAYQSACHQSLFILAYRRFVMKEVSNIKDAYITMMTILATHTLNCANEEFNDKTIIQFLLDRNEYVILFMLILQANKIDFAVFERVDFNELIVEFFNYVNQLRTTKGRYKLANVIMNAESPLGQILRSEIVEPFIIEQALQIIFKQDRRDTVMPIQMIKLALPHAQSVPQLRDYLKIYEADALSAILIALEKILTSESKAQSPNAFFAANSSKLLTLQSEVKKRLSIIEEVDRLARSVANINCKTRRLG